MAKTKAKVKSKTTSKAKTKNNSLDLYMQIAQIFTMSSAILYGAVWSVLGMLDNNQPAWAITGMDYMLAATMSGGIMMGLVYALQHMEKLK